MTEAQAHGGDQPRGGLARPLDALVFLLPLIVFYEFASLSHPGRVIAFDLLRHFLELFGNVGVWAPGLAVITILLATHVASGESWRIEWGRIGAMYVEAAVFAAPLLALYFLVPLSGGASEDALFYRLALGVGAGVYEELVFRLVLLSMLMIIGADLLRLERRVVAVGAIALSALIFAAHHHQPIGIEPFNAAHFAFRTMAGLYLATVFWYRGYGMAAGCHAMYNVAVVLLLHWNI